MSEKRLLVVSNRLPAAIYRDNADWKVKPSPGGLVTALAPIMKRNRGVWIGWPGCTPDAPATELLAEFSAQNEYDLKPVALSQQEQEDYYRGFANKSLWPLFHDLLGHFSFDLKQWQAYVDVNRRFAEVTAQHLRTDSFTWIHDYQLLLVGRFLRQIGVKSQLNFFLHIPFPSLDLFRRLPWKQDVLDALLDYDHVGFQTARDRRNFIQCVKWFNPDVQRVAFRRRSTVRYRGRNIILGHYPISIDFDEFDLGAKQKEVAEAAWFLHEHHRDQRLVLGLDRLDYTKGIPERFLGFERLLEKYPEVREKITLLQIVVPSRASVSEYRALKERLDSLAGRINSTYSSQGWTPIHYQYRELDRIQLLGHYRACEIALITPLRDGMNLVAKEYCAASVDNRGVLVLSEFAGAANQLAQGALLVNPYDLEGTADALYAAFVMDQSEREERMKRLRSEIKRNNVSRWVDWFLRYETPPSHAERVAEFEVSDQ